MERCPAPAGVLDQGGPDRLGAVRAAHGQRGREQDLGDLAVSAAGLPRGHGHGVGYVNSRKGIHAGRRTTWISLTAAGRTALNTHVAALRELIAGVE